MGRCPVIRGGGVIRMLVKVVLSPHLRPRQMLAYWNAPIHSRASSEFDGHRTIALEPIASAPVGRIQVPATASDRSLHLRLRVTRRKAGRRAGWQPTRHALDVRRATRSLSEIRRIPRIEILEQRRAWADGTGCRHDLCGASPSGDRRASRLKHRSMTPPPLRGTSPYEWGGK